MIKHKSEKEHETEIDLNEIIKSDQDKAENKPEMSAEAKKLFLALDEYIAKNEGRAFYSVRFGAHDESGTVIDNYMDYSGENELILGTMKDMTRLVELRMMNWI